MARGWMKKIWKKHSYLARATIPQIHNLIIGLGLDQAEFLRKHLLPDREDAEPAESPAPVLEAFANVAVARYCDYCGIDEDLIRASARRGCLWPGAGRLISSSMNRTPPRPSTTS